MRRPAHECRRMMQDLRAAFYQKSYNEQNYVLLGNFCLGLIRRMVSFKECLGYFLYW